MGVIHICGNRHKITRATIVIYSGEKVPTFPDHLVMPLCATNNQYIYPRQQNVWISPAMGMQNVYINYNARIYMY